MESDFIRILIIAQPIAWQFLQVIWIELIINLILLSHIHIALFINKVWLLPELLISYYFAIGRVNFCLNCFGLGLSILWTLTYKESNCALCFVSFISSINNSSAARAPASILEMVFDPLLTSFLWWSDLFTTCLALAPIKKLHECLLRQCSVWTHCCLNTCANWKFRLLTLAECLRVLVYSIQDIFLQATSIDLLNFSKSLLFLFLYFFIDLFVKSFSFWKRKATFGVVKLKDSLCLSYGFFILVILVDLKSSLSWHFDWEISSLNIRTGSSFWVWLWISFAVASDILCIVIWK